MNVRHTKTRSIIEETRSKRSEHFTLLSVRMEFPNFLNLSSSQILS